MPWLARCFLAAGGASKTLICKVFFIGFFGGMLSTYLFLPFPRRDQAYNIPPTPEIDIAIIFLILRLSIRLVAGWLAGWLACWRGAG